MDFADLCRFWNQREKQIAKALPQGTAALADILQAGADAFDLVQRIDRHTISWFDQEGQIVIMYYLIPDARDLDRVLDAYVKTREKQCPFTAVLVHQWTDGEGNWDIFLITEKWAMQHGGRLCGSDHVEERGPQLREDTYTLFACDREFPEPGEEEWVKLLNGPIEGIVTQLETLAQRYNCAQTYRDYLVQWRAQGQLEVQFFLFPDQKDLTPFIYLYRHLKEEPSPVSFVLVECEQEQLRDIFRLSARSYLEHHNRPGHVCGEEGVPGASHVEPIQLDQDKAKIMEKNLCREGNKVWLAGVEGWSSSEKVSSVHAALEQIMRASGESVSYEYLVGISSLAFRMQVGGLCPSSPHPACGYPCINRSLELFSLQSKAHDFDQDKRKVPAELFDVIVQSIDAGLPVSTGEEEDGLIIGYNQESKALIAYHPHTFDGSKPFVIAFDALHKICWGIGVYAKPRNEPIDHQALVIESLKQAVTMARQERADNYDLGFKAWDTYIHTLETQKKLSRAELLGNAWIYECLIQYRQIAAQYLREVSTQFNEAAQPHLKLAADLYDQMARKILIGDKPASEIAPYPQSLGRGQRWTIDKRRDQITRLQQALALEVQAINAIETALACS